MDTIWAIMCAFGRFYMTVFGKLPWYEQLGWWIVFIIFVSASEVSRSHMTWGGRKRDD